MAGPTPSRVSSCSSVAVLRLTGWSGAGRGGRGRGCRRRGLDARTRDEDLAAVLELGGAVDLAQVGAAGRAAGALERVLDPLARREPVDARLLDRAGDVDRRRCRRPRRARRCSPPPAVGRRRPRVVGAPGTTRRAERGRGRPRPRRPCGGDRGRAWIEPRFDRVACLSRGVPISSRKCNKSARQMARDASDDSLGRVTTLVAKLRRAPGWRADRRAQRTTKLTSLAGTTTTFTICLPSMWASDVGALARHRLELLAGRGRRRLDAVADLAVDLHDDLDDVALEQREVGVRPWGLPHAVAGQRLVDLGAGVRARTGRSATRRSPWRSAASRVARSRAGGRPR